MRSGKRNDHWLEELEPTLRGVACSNVTPLAMGWNMTDDNNPPMFDTARGAKLTVDGEIERPRTARHLQLGPDRANVIGLQWRFGANTLGLVRRPAAAFMF